MFQSEILWHSLLPQKRHRFRVKSLASIFVIDLLVPRDSSLGVVHETLGEISPTPTRELVGSVVVRLAGDVKGLGIRNPMATQGNVILLDSIEKKNPR